MALLGNFLTIRLQQHSSGVATKVVAETTSVDAQFTAEALESTEQADALVARFEPGKTTINVSGDYLQASDGEQFELLFAHANAGDKIEVDLYRSGQVFLSTEGVFTSLNDSGGLSDSLVTGAYSMELDVVAGSFYGPVLNVSNCENTDYTTFANGTPTGFDAVSNGTATHEAGTADEISFTSGTQYYIEFDEVLNSGTAPFVNLASAPTTGISDEGAQVSANGSNVFTFTCNTTTTGMLVVLNTSDVSDFELTNLSVREIL